MEIPMATLSAGGVLQLAIALIAHRLATLGFPCHRVYARRSRTMYKLAKASVVSNRFLFFISPR